MGVVLALASALVWGASDFCGGLATRRSTAAGVVALSQLIGLVAVVVLVLGVPAFGGSPTTTDLLWGVLGGGAGAAGLVVFYRAMAAGVMSVVAPLTAVTAAAVPVVVGLGLGDRLAVWTGVGIVLALLAVVLVAAEGGLPTLEQARRAGIGPALAAGAGFGLFFVALAQTTSGSGLWPLVTVRATSVVVIGLGTLIGRQVPRVSAAVLPVVLVAGVGDMAGNALYLLATRHGSLAVTAVLSSLYPLTTVLLAQAVLGERLVRTQLAGLACAVAAVALISLPA